jgi:hypothetical protein
LLTHKHIHFACIIATELSFHLQNDNMNENLRLNESYIP